MKKFLLFFTLTLLCAVRVNAVPATTDADTVCLTITSIKLADGENPTTLWFNSGECIDVKYPLKLTLIAYGDVDKEFTIFIPGYMPVTISSDTDRECILDFSHAPQVTWTVIDRSGNPLPGADVTYGTVYRVDESGEFNETYDYKIATTGADGKATFYNTLADTDSPFDYRKLVLRPNREGYINWSNENRSEMTDETIDYSNDEVTVTIRAKNAMTSNDSTKWQACYPYFNFDFSKPESYNKEIFSLSFDEYVTDGNDLVWTGKFFKSEYENIGNITCGLNGYKIIGAQRTIEAITGNAINIEYDTQLWHEVDISYKGISGIAHVSIDGSKYFQVEKSPAISSVYLPEGEHLVAIYADGRDDFLDTIKSNTIIFASPQTFTVTNAQNQKFNYDFNTENYTGIQLTVRKIDGNRRGINMALEVSYSNGSYSYSGCARTSILSGKVNVYAADPGTFSCQLYGIDGDAKHYAPRSWKEEVGMDVKKDTIDYSQFAHKLTLIVTPRSDDDSPHFSHHFDGTFIEEGFGLPSSSLEKQDDGTYQWYGYVPQLTFNGRIEYNYGVDGIEIISDTTIAEDKTINVDFNNYVPVTYTVDGVAYDAFKDSLSNTYKSVFPADDETRAYCVKNDINNLDNCAYLKPGSYTAVLFNNSDNAPITAEQTFTVTEGVSDVTVNLATLTDEQKGKVTISFTGTTLDVNKVQLYSKLSIYDVYEDYYTLGTQFLWVPGRYEYYIAGNLYTSGNDTYHIMKRITATGTVTGGMAQTLTIDMTGYKAVTLKFQDAFGNDLNSDNLDGYSFSFMKLADDLYGSSENVIVPMGTYNGEFRFINDNRDSVYYHGTAVITTDGDVVVRLTDYISSGITMTATDGAPLGACFTSEGLLISGSGQSVSVSVYDLQGRSVLVATAKDGTTVDTRLLASGIYVVRLQQGTTTKTFKLTR